MNENLKLKLTLIFIIMLVHNLMLPAQTKLISLKSHSGSEADFSLEESGNMGITISIVLLDEENKSFEELKRMSDSISNHSSPVGIKTKEGLYFYDIEDYERYTKLRDLSDKRGYKLIIYNERDYQDVENLTDSSMHAGDSIVYLRSSEGFMFETKTELEEYQKLRNSRQSKNIEVEILEEDKDSIRIAKLTDQTMQTDKKVYFIRSNTGVLFDLRSMFDNYQKIKKSIKDADIIVISKNDSILSLQTDSIAKNRSGEESRFLPFSSFSSPSDNGNSLGLLVGIVLIIVFIALILAWKERTTHS